MASSRDLLLLTIETLTENAFDVIMHRKALVEDLKLRIKFITGIDPVDQHILLGSIELKDEMSLEYYKLETGSKLRLVTSMRGGPISFRRPSPVPPFINLAAFLLAASESDSPSNKATSRQDRQRTEENTNDRGQPVAYFIIHDGVIVKITEFESDTADEESISFLKRMSKDALSGVSRMEDEEEIKRLIENERTKEKMKNLRKNMEHANELREKMKAKRMSRPDPPRFFSPNSQKRETLNSILYSRKGSKASGKRANSIEPSESVEETHRKADIGNDRSKKMSNIQKMYSEQRQFKDALKVTPMHVLGKQNQKFTQTLPIVSHSTREYDDLGELEKGSRKSKKSGKADRKDNSLHYTEENAHGYFLSNESSGGSRPAYRPGFLGSNFERYINEEEFMRQTRSMEERGRSMDYNLNLHSHSSGTSRKASNRDETRRSRDSRGSNAVHFDSLITLMAQTIMGSARRSFEKRSSTSRNKVGLTPRRFTHDGRTNNEVKAPPKDPASLLPPLSAAKLNPGPTSHAKLQGEQRPLGMVMVDRCAVCNKKLGIATTFRCLCGKMFCANHKFPEEHQCDYDYKKSGREQIKKNNPVVDGNKLNKI